jgi:hypothetical protein
MNQYERNDWDSAESRAYIQNWLQDSKPTPEQIKQVLTGANKILTAGK